jgi:hypothetical protein
VPFYQSVVPVPVPQTQSTFVQNPNFQIFQSGVNGMRFGIDYGSFQEMDPTKVSIFKTIILPNAINKLSRTIRPIQRQKIQVSLNDMINLCTDEYISISNFYANGFPDVDYLMFVNLSQLDPEVSGAANSCVFSTSLRRSVVGTFLFNSSYLDRFSSTFEVAIETTIHEFFHSIFFDIETLKVYPPNRMGQSILFYDSAGVARVRSDNFINFARSHFNCNYF